MKNKEKKKRRDGEGKRGSTRDDSYRVEDEVEGKHERRQLQGKRRGRGQEGEQKKEHLTAVTHQCARTCTLST